MCSYDILTHPSNITHVQQQLLHTRTSSEGRTISSFMTAARCFKLIFYKLSKYFFPDKKWSDLFYSSIYIYNYKLTDHFIRHACAFTSISKEQQCSNQCIQACKYHNHIYMPRCFGCCHLIGGLDTCVNNQISRCT